MTDLPDLGAVRPPRVYLASLAIGALLELALPARLLPASLAAWLGAPLTVIAVALFASSAASFRAAGTPVPARKPTTAIVRKGPYRLSRNPMYLAFSLFQLGVAIAVNSVWLLGTLVAAVSLMNGFVIPREEAYLERRFGAEYRRYKAAVRRWL